MNVTEPEIHKVITDAEFDFYTNGKPFNEVLYEAIQKLRDIHVRATVRKAATMADLTSQFGGGDER